MDGFRCDEAGLARVADHLGHLSAAAGVAADYTHWVRPPADGGLQALVGVVAQQADTLMTSVRDLYVHLERVTDAARLAVAAGTTTYRDADQRAAARVAAVVDVLDEVAR